MNKGFAHGLKVDRIYDGQRIAVVADEAERAAIASRLELDRIDRLEAHATLTRDGDVIRAEGRLAAALAQRCVITDEPVAAHVDEPFTLEFRPEPEARGPEDEIELGQNELDTIFYDGAIIDLGAAVADTLALSLDPFPRSAGADAALKEAGVMSEAEASPFAVLAALRRGDES
ncbi:MAG: DUF177 domain-containing protein [Sphingomicrobium sp.]